MRKLVAAVGLIVSLGAGGPAEAQGRALSLPEAIRLALDHNRAVAQSDQQLEAADADVLAARAAFLPRLSANGSWTKPEPTSFFEQGQFFLIDQNFWRLGANASITLFDGLGNFSGYQRAQRAREAARKSDLDSRQEVVYQTESRFLEVLKQQSLLAVQQEAVRQSEEQLKKTRAMKDLGAATQADVFKAQVDHSNNRLAELRTERDLLVAKATLADYVGLDPREEVELSSTTLETADEFVLSSAFERALELNPLLDSARSSLEASEAAVSVAKASRYPDLSAFYALSFANTSLDSFDDEHIEWQYGLRMNFTIFDGFLTKSSIRRSQAQLVFDERNLETVERQILLAVRQSYLDLEIAKRSIEVATEAVRSSEEDLRLAQERYKIGEGTILDVIDAQVNLTRSKTDRVNAVHDRRLAVSALRNAIGDLPVPESP